MGKEFFLSRDELHRMIYEVDVDRRVVQPAGVVRNSPHLNPLPLGEEAKPLAQPAAGPAG